LTGVTRDGDVHHGKEMPQSPKLKGSEAAEFRDSLCLSKVKQLVSDCDSEPYGASGIVAFLLTQLRRRSKGFSGTPQSILGAVPAKNS